MAFGLNPRLLSQSVTSAAKAATKAAEKAIVRLPLNPKPLSEPQHALRNSQVIVDFPDDFEKPEDAGETPSPPLTNPSSPDIADTPVEEIDGIPVIETRATKDALLEEITGDALPNYETTPLADLVLVDDEDYRDTGAKTLDVERLSHPTLRTRLINEINLYANMLCIDNGGLEPRPSTNVHALFHRKKIPHKPIDTFLHSLAEYTKVDESCLIAMLLLMQRYCAEKDINYLNVQYLMTVCLLVADKMVGEDRLFIIKNSVHEIKTVNKDKRFADCSTMSMKDIKTLEIDVLHRIKHSADWWKPVDVQGAVNKLGQLHKKINPKYFFLTTRNYPVADLADKGGIRIPPEMRKPS